MTGHVTDVYCRESKRLGTTAIVSADLDYTTASGELLVSGRGSSFVYDVVNAQSTDRQSAMADAHRRMAPTAIDDVITPLEAFASVERRGSAPRFWQDVVAGEEIPALAKGTLDNTEICLLLSGRGRARGCGRADPTCTRAALGGEAARSDGRHRDPCPRACFGGYERRGALPREVPAGSRVARLSPASQATPCLSLPAGDQSAGEPARVTSRLRVAALV
jgi:hypothetical protein